MARVQPFKALRFASLDSLGQRIVGDPGRGISGEGPRLVPLPDEPLHVERLLLAPDPWLEVRRWKEAGHLFEEAPVLYVIETRSAGADAFADRPVRYLLGAMTADDGVPLEQGQQGQDQPPLTPVPVLAADDHDVVRQLLAQLTVESAPVWEGLSQERRLRMWRVGSTAVGKRLRAALEEAPLRPHGPVPAKGPFLAAVVPLSEPGLRLLPWHRGLRGLPSFDPERFLALVSDYARIFELELPLTAPGGMNAALERLGTLSEGRHAFLLVLPGGQGRLLRFKHGLELSHLPAVPKNPTLRSLDVALLNALVFRTVLGIQDPQARGHPNVHAVARLEKLVEQVDGKVFQAGFALNPPPMWEIRAVMEARQVLPPRTFRLSPLPPAGLLMLAPARS